MPSLFDEYVEGGAARFFDGHPARLEDRVRAVRRARRPIAPEVVDVLQAQAARHPGSPARDAHLLALRNGAAAVVTGQQVGLFLGPLYTVYKAATAIRVARALEAESGDPVVPVFWLQTEDHDIEEIASVSIGGPPGSEPVLLALPVPAGNRVSVEHLLLPAEVDASLQALRKALVPLPHADEHVDHLRQHYRPGATWVDAFAGMIAELFAPEGLVLVDPRDEALARFAAPVHRRALQDAGAIAAALDQRRAELEAAGHEAMVRIRPGSPLSFFHPEGALGPRCRLDATGTGFAEAESGRLHSLEALVLMLETQPLAFSTSALLRPVLQDTLLPTAAYVGGPGEVAYLAQVAPLHAAFEIPMPLVVPRARFRVVDESVARILDRHGLQPEDAALDEDALLRKCRAKDGRGLEPDDVVRALKAPFDEALDALAPALLSSGQGMDRAIARTRATVDDAVGKLAGKHERALLHRDEKLVDDVRRVRQALHPGGEPQERVLALASFAARRGERAFLEQVLAAIEPFDFHLGTIS